VLRRVGQQLLPGDQARHGAAAPRTRSGWSGRMLADLLRTAGNGCEPDAAATARDLDRRRADPDRSETLLLAWTS
jgi:hypothetical protein